MHDYFGAEIASRYDETSAEMFESSVLEPAVEALARLANGGAALEFGVGTGRIALPLAGRGVDVYGIDLSPAMVARLRAKPGGDAIDVTIGDISTTLLDGRAGSFSLVYLVWNTIMNLTTQAAQVACFRSAAWHLVRNGKFVIEVGLPDLRRLPPGETLRPIEMTEGRIGFDEYDVANQGLWSHFFYFEEGRVRRDSTPFRYVWPSELDLMAELAGLRPRERWSGWDGEPFASDSRRLIGVWEKPAI